MTHRIVERLKGVGEVLKDAQRVCRVHYQLRQEIVESGQATVTGEVTLRSSEPLSAEVLATMGSGQALTLRLADNRSLKVFFNPEIDVFTGIWRWSVVNASPDGFAPA